ncbi:hypothetical protein AMST5_00085 [freshwater sediment metagenome]|uniref:ABC transmembrane type-1 domain-containing protein n=1 Tax=freshwater sediment metagenome TaxID=556182 RepID=A0AA48LXX4_9ZZZZ
MLRRLVTFVFQIFEIVIFVQLCFLAVKFFSGNNNPFAAGLDLRSLIHDLQAGDNLDLVIIAAAMRGTLFHASSIVALSIICGIVLGYGVVGSALVRFFLTPILDFLRGIPASIIYPIAAVSFNTKTDAFVIVIGSIPCTTIMAFATINALRRIKPEREMIYVINTEEHSQLKLFFEYRLRSMLPDIVEGVSLSASYALVLSCVLEMLLLGPQGTAGAFISIDSDAHAGRITSEAIALIVLIGLASFTLNFLANRAIESGERYRF